VRPSQDLASASVLGTLQRAYGVWATCLGARHPDAHVALALRWE